MKHQEMFHLKSAKKPRRRESKVLANCHFRIREIAKGKSPFSPSDASFPSDAR